MKKNLVLVFSALLSPLNSLAGHLPTVILGGELNTQAGYIDEDKNFRIVEGKTKKDSAIVNDTKITAKAEGEINGLKYGALIKINADTSATKSGSDKIGDKTMLYVEGSFGRLEGGNTNGSTSKMKVSATSIAVATGGIDGDSKYWINRKTHDKKKVEDVFISDPNLPIGCDLSTKFGKISYYTPNINGFSFGISYLPNSFIKGTASLLSQPPQGKQYHNLIESAINYNYKSNDIGFSLGLSNQYGKSVKHSSDNESYHNLNAWEAGAKFSYGSLTFAGSYGNWGKSGTKTSLPKQNSYLWTLGAAYKYDKFGASVTYYQSNKAHDTTSTEDAPQTEASASNKKYNKLEMLSFGIEHNTFPGFKPYAEVTFFKHNKKDITINNKGQVYLTGVKISF